MISRISVLTFCLEVHFSSSYSQSNSSTLENYNSLDVILTSSPFVKIRALLQNAK